MSRDAPSSEQDPRPTQYYCDEYGSALAQHDYARRVHAVWGLTAKGGEAIPYALSLLLHEDYDARADGANILGTAGRGDVRQTAVVAALVGAIQAESQRPEPGDGHEREAMDALLDALTLLDSASASAVLNWLNGEPNADSIENYLNG